MPTWSDVLVDFQQQPPEERGRWLFKQQQLKVAELADIRGRNILSYGSAFLQKPQVPAAYVSITSEDVNGLMSAIHGMDWSKGLTLILHTPGGVTNATESIVEYLRSKFSYVEVVIPVMAMSAGTMISLAANRIIIGRQSQMGPIDPQMQLGGKSVSAKAVVEQFERAKLEILAERNTAHVWAPILQSLGPSLLQEAQNALDYSEQIVAGWLTKYMFSGNPNAEAEGKRVAHHFNDASFHKSHGRRIGLDEARTQGLSVESLESDQTLQESVLTLYHLMTICFENTPTVKLILSSTEQSWIKNFATPEEAELIARADDRQKPPQYSKPAPGAKPSRQRR